MIKHRNLESRVRRAAKRVKKSRVRNHHCNDCGLFQLVDDCNVIIGGAAYHATLDELTSWIANESIRLAG